MGGAACNDGNSRTTNYHCNGAGTCSGSRPAPPSPPVSNCMPRDSNTPGLHYQAMSCNHACAPNMWTRCVPPGYVWSGTRIRGASGCFYVIGTTKPSLGPTDCGG